MTRSKSDPSSAGSAGLSSASSGRGLGARSGKLSEIRSAVASCAVIGVTRDSSRMFDWLAEEISPPSISCAEASPVKMCPAREKALALLAVARACGLNLPGLSGSSAPNGSSSKMSRVAPRGGSIKCATDWDGSVMLLFRSRCRRLLLGPPTSVKGSSWSRGEYPTPAASQSGSSNNGNPRDGRGEYATKGRESLEPWAKRWATPTAKDRERSGYGESSRRAGKSSTRHTGTTLTDMAVRGHGHPHPTISSAGESSSQMADLNPQFVAALMGFPVEWLGASGAKRSKR